MHSQHSSLVCNSRYTTTSAFTQYIEIDRITFLHFLALVQRKGRDRKGKGGVSDQFASSFKKHKSLPANAMPLLSCAPMHDSHTYHTHTLFSHVTNHYNLNAPALKTGHKNHAYTK